MFTIDDYRWLTSPAGSRAWTSLCESQQTPTIATLQRLRTNLSATQAALLMEQLQLAQSNVARKFSDPLRWFWTRPLLEQSSDEHTAKETASDFPIECNVLDGCCGAGADTVAIARESRVVTAVDMSDIACELTRYNTSSHGLIVDVKNCEIDPTFADTRGYLHIDPDRRIQGSRTISIDHCSPNLHTIATLLPKFRGTSLKLAPGTRADTNELKSTIEPPEAKRWLSRDGSVRQQRWYWGIDRWPRNSLTVSTQRNDLAWHHETFTDGQYSTDPFGYDVLDIIIQSPSQLEGYIADYDPSIRAAQLSIAFAQRYRMGLIGTESGYFAAAAPVKHPMLRWFRIIEVMPLDRKRLKSFARLNAPRVWELKSRGIDVDLDSMRKLLAVDRSGSRSLTLLLTKIDKSHTAIIAEPLGVTV